VVTPAPQEGLSAPPAVRPGLNPGEKSGENIKSPRRQKGFKRARGQIKEGNQKAASPTEGPGGGKPREGSPEE